MDTSQLNALQKLAYIMVDGMVRKFIEFTGGSIWIVTAVPVSKERVEMITLGAGCQCEQCVKMTQDLLPQLQDVASKVITERHGGEFKFIDGGNNYSEREEKARE